MKASCRVRSVVRSNQPVRLSPLWWAVACLLWASPSGIGQTSGSTVDSFKSFMQSRPAIQKVVFSRQVLVAPPRGGPVPASITNEIQFYQGAWQPDGFFIRRLADLKQVDEFIGETTSTAGFLFAGKAGDKLWHIVDTNIYYSTQEKSDDFVTQTSTTARELLSACLSFGAERMAPRSLEWQGDDFTARTESGGKMHGTLMVTNGLPAKLVVNYEGQDSGYTADYTYAASEKDRLPYGLPNTVLETFVQRKRSIPQYRQTMVYIDCADHDLTKGFFSPDFFISAPARQIVARDNALYIRNGNSEEKMRDLPANPHSSKSKRLLLTLLIIGLPAALLALALTRKRKNKTAA
jgi:hypothetical protein